MIIPRLQLLCLLFAVTFGHRVLKVDLLSNDSTLAAIDTSDDSRPQRRTLLARTASDHRVLKLPGLDPSVDIVSYAGYLPIEQDNSRQLFYWLIEAPTNAEKYPLVIWLNGGPGCSSMDGLWLELGPFRLTGDMNTVKINPYSWHHASNVLFIDQPVGTGFSYSTLKDGLARNDEMINRHFYGFLKNFFALHDRYVFTDRSGVRKTRDLFLTGESHAGHYIPTISNYIQQQNKDATQLFISMKGIALGNPWIDPYNQYDVSEYVHSLGLITERQMLRAQTMDKTCKALLRQGKLNQRACFQLLDVAIDATVRNKTLKALMYDARKFVRNPKYFPPGHEAVERYLNRLDVRVAVHVANESKQRYMECADPPYHALAHQDGKGVTGELTRLLDSGLRVLVFSGQYDIVCHYMGSERALNELNWTSRSQWRDVLAVPWYFGGKVVGKIRQYKNLQSLLVLDASHMVPMDVPDVALKMLELFVRNESFDATGKATGASIGADSGQGVPSRRNKATDTANDNTDAAPYTKKRRKPNSRKPSHTKVFDKTSTHRQMQSAVGQAGMHAASHSHSGGQPHVSISHVVPLDNAIMVRLRVQSTHGPNHHSHRLGRKKAHHNITGLLELMQHASSSDSGTNDIPMHNSHVLILQPGAREFPIYVDPRLYKRVMYDVTIHNLTSGSDYHLHVRTSHSNVTSSSINNAASKQRAVTVRPGCYSRQIHPQCCGHGECVLRTSNDAAAQSKADLMRFFFSQSDVADTKCRCDPGYSGDHCDFYEVQATGGDSSGRASNVSNADNMCPPLQLRHEHSVNISFFYN